jgi:hypothetical protein
MLNRQPVPIPPECFEDFAEEHTKPEPVDDFMSVLIAAYEHVLDQGTKPPVALTAVLGWASLEIRRYVR